MTNPLLDTLAGKQSTSVPVWLMRQAGRYLPEYMAVRRNVKDFMELCGNPQLATKVTLQPIERFNFDAAIIFSDIMVIPEAIGHQVSFANGAPICLQPLIPGSDLETLHERVANFDSARDLPYVTEALASTRAQLPEQTALLGFCGSPWTLFSYMLPSDIGRGDRLATARSVAFEFPQWTKSVLDQLAILVVKHLRSQVRAGANAVQLFDSWGAALSIAQYRQIALPSMQHIVEQIRDDTPIIVFSKGVSLPLLQDIAALQPHALSLDWNISFQTVRETVTQQIPLQGNLDPAVLTTDEDTVRRAVDAVMHDYEAATGSMQGLIFNLGHGIIPQAKPELVAVLVDQVKQYS